MSDKLLPVAIVPLRAKPIITQLWEGYPGCLALLLAGGGVALGWMCRRGW